MQKKFKYIKGLTHGAYQFRYQHKEKPTYYKFNYRNGVCHGIYKFTYGEKEKPIYVENPPKQYTYWGREIDVEKVTPQYTYWGRALDIGKVIKQYTYWGREIDAENVAIKLSIPIKSIYLENAVVLMERAIKYIEQHQGYSLEQKQFLKKIIDDHAYLLEIASIKEVTENVQLLKLERSKKQLDALEPHSSLENKGKQLGLLQIGIVLEMLATLKFEIAHTISLNLRDNIVAEVEEAIELKKRDHYINVFSTSELGQSDLLQTSVFEDEMLYRNLFNEAQIEATETLKRTLKKEMMGFVCQLKQLVRVDTFEVSNQQNPYQMDRVTDFNLLTETMKFIGSKNKNELWYRGTERFARKYSKAHVSKARRLDKKVQSCRLSKSTLLERKIEKDMLQEVYYYLKRIILKDMLVDEGIQLMIKGKARDILINHLEQYMDKPINKEISQHENEILFGKIVIRELSTLIHDKILTFINNKELMQNEIVQQLTKLQDRSRFIQIDDQEQVIEDITKYPLFIEKVTQGLQDALRNIDIEEIEKFTENLLKNVLLEEETQGSRLPKVLAKEDSIQVGKELLLKLEESEQTLKLYKRFWIVGNSDFKDLMILPSHDYPYESEPIIEDVELMPENHHVVYPNEFYKCIDRHPIPNGIDLAPDEIGVAINILIDLINIFIMMWCKFTPAFWGWTGTQAVLGMVDSVYEFITLETSRGQQLKEDVKEQYDRAYKWLRWEGEQMALRARHDPELRGNYYVGLMLEELIYYMIDHHFDVMPLFEDVNKMDEWRTMFDRNVNRDIKFVLDKVKGIRHKLLEKEVRAYES